MSERIPGLPLAYEVVLMIILVVRKFTIMVSVNFSEILMPHLITSQSTFIQPASSTCDGVFRFSSVQPATVAPKT